MHGTYDIVAQYLTFESLVAFLTLTALEIVLGIDNIIFIAIQAGNLPPDQRDRGRRLGLAFAVVSRIILLLGISYAMRMDTAVANIAGLSITIKDLVELVGGLFLIRQATVEIRTKVQARHHGSDRKLNANSLRSMVIQIVLMDVVFSLDSVITAVGMSGQIPIMIAAIVAAVGVMMAYSGIVVEFIERNPAIRMLALAFLLMIGVVLVAQGCHQDIDKRYVYFAMAFSLGVELLHIRAEHNAKRRKRQAARSSADADHPDKARVEQHVS